MDCCNYAYGAGAAAWEYAPPYAPYAHGYYAPAHDPYARYYRLDYPQHVHHAEPHVPPDYGAYAAKEVRSRRALARRDRVHPPAQHQPLPPTPPLEIGMNRRGPAYGEPQMWPHYQMGVMNGGGWGGGHPANGDWASRGSCARDQMRYPDHSRQIKGPQLPAQNPMCQQDGRSTPYPGYEEANTYNGESTPRHENAHHFSAVSQSESARSHRSRFISEVRRSPPKEKRPPVVPLPAFQQAFGSTEIGKFSEAFTRTEAAQENATADNFLYESFTEWDGTTEPQWSTQPAAREIKCEDNY